MQVLKEVWTSGSLAAHFGVSREVILYIVRTRRIEPIGRAGSALIYNSKAVAEIARYLAQRRNRQNEEVASNAT